MQLRARAALLDIEGTIGPIAFVRDVLFPYSRSRMDAFVAKHRDEPRVRAVLDATAREAGTPAGDVAAALKVLREWSDSDVKATPLKELQGMIWEQGYASGVLVSQLYEDAIVAMRRWRLQGAHLYVYSSGSIEAQHLLFAHSNGGDLRPLFGDFFDTTSGPKRDPASYARIVKRIGLPHSEVVFFSDVHAELDAALEAGLQVVHVARPEDGVRPSSTHPAVDSFDGIDIER